MMRAVLRFAAMILLVLGTWAAPPWPAYAANLDTTADHVIGQPDFIHKIYNNPSLGAKSLGGPYRVALNAKGDLFVADTGNNRVLEFAAPLSPGATASRVFGQPDFTHGDANHGGLSAKSLNTPTGVALDSQGNLYVADAFNNRVLEYDAPLASSMAASHVVGQGGSFTSAVVNNGGLNESSLNGPFSIALDARGDLFVADYLNNRVLEFDDPIGDPRANQVYGQPDDTSNTANNGGLSARTLDGPIGVTLDGQGNLYVADHYNNRVLEFDSALTSDGIADRVFGQPDFIHNTANNGGVSATSLSGPIDVAADARGSLYVADSSNNRVLEYDAPLGPDATADFVFGQPDFTVGTANNGGVSATRLSSPQGVALDAQDNLYVADGLNNRVLEYDVPVPNSVPVLSALGPSTVAAGGPAFTLTVNGSGFVAGSVVQWNGSKRPTTFINSTQLSISVSLADLAGGGPFPVSVFTPLPGGGASNLLNLSLYARLGHDATADAVQGQPDFSGSAQNNLLLPGANRLNGALGMAVDKHSGRLFAADTFNNRVLSWPNAPAFANAQPADLVLGQPTLLANTPNNGGVSARSLSQPYQMALDAQGNLYVADERNNRVLEYDAPLSSGMAASRAFGQGGNFTTAVVNNGGVSANSLDRPTGLALDAHGNLYVADGGNNRVLEYDTPLSTDTTADRVLGQPDMAHNNPNTGGLSATSLVNPFGLALDGQGRLYVSDLGNNRALEFDAPLTSGMAASRVFGQPDFGHDPFNNGGVSAKSLGAPEGLALDGWGNLYVADYFNNRVLEYDVPLSSDMAATRVFGQPDFIHNTIISGGVSANSLAFPAGVVLDAQANLYVADAGNSRVLEYDWALFKLRLPLVVR